MFEKKKIMTSFHFPQFEHELFWRYYWRLGDFLPPNHGIEQWEICQVMYNGLNEETRALVERMNNGEFLWKSPDDAWEFFEWLAKDTYEYEMAMNEGCQLNLPSTFMSSPTPYPSPCHHLSSFDSSYDQFETNTPSLTLEASFCDNEYDSGAKENTDSYYAMEMDPTPFLTIQNLSSFLEKSNEDIYSDHYSQVHPIDFPHDHIEISASSLALEDDLGYVEDESNVEECLDLCYEMVKEIIEVKDPYVPFSKKMDLIPSFPIQGIPSFLSEQIEDVYCDLNLLNGVQIGEVSVLPGDLCNPSCFNLSLEVSFDFPLPLHAMFYVSSCFNVRVMHDIFYILYLISLIILLFYLLYFDFNGSDFDKLLRSLSNYLLERSS